MANRYCIIEVATGLVTGTAVWDGETEWAPPEGYIAVASDVADKGWSYVNEEFIKPEVPPPTPEEVAFKNNLKLQEYKTYAELQKTALATRVGVLTDAVEYDMATPEEIAELPIRVAQRKAWGQYAVYLGRVTAQPGWPTTVDWPVQPTDGWDLTTSARATTAV